MLATKETAVLAMASFAAGLIAAFGVRVGRGLRWRHGAAFAAALLATASLLLAPPWRWAALAPAVTGYLARGLNAGGHAHPWTYYLALVWWALPPAAAGLVVAVRSRRPFARFVACYSVAVAAAYCAIPYKTPWCVLTMLYGFALLAGMAAEEFARRWRAPVIVVSVAGLAFLGLQAWIASTTKAADQRNPLAYSQTEAGVFTIRDRLREIAGAAPQGPRIAIAVYSRQNLWPLPWYFREFPNVEWWRDVAIPGRAAPVVLVSPEMEDGLARKIYEGPPPGQRELYMSMFDAAVELRPQVEVRGYVARSLWDRWRETR
jgi:hypothetical protein